MSYFTSIKRALAMSALMAGMVLGGVVWTATTSPIAHAHSESFYCGHYGYDTLDWSVRFDGTVANFPAHEHRYKHYLYDQVGHFWYYVHAAIYACPAH